MTAARIPADDHLARPWRVHALAPDFELLDVWRFPVRGGAGDFQRFTRLMGNTRRIADGTNWMTRALFGLRLVLGKTFGWDRERAPLPIPGCREHSIAARMPGGRDVVEPRSASAFHPIYADERETLSELSNGTVHGLVHFGWVELEDGAFAPQMAVYVKPRGLLGRAYMGLISPFRHFVVYPSLLRAVERRWSGDSLPVARASA